MRSFWTFTEQELLQELAVDKEMGLSAQDVLVRRKKWGANSLRTKKEQGVWQLLFAQINTPLMYMLLFAAFLSLFLYDKTDALIIFFIIGASTLLSFFQERGAIKTMQRLLQIVQVKVDVIRSQTKTQIPIEEVVPGDIITFCAGDIIPADCYLLHAKDLYVDEATLTGESFYTEKAPATLSEDTPLSKRSNVLFMGTHVISGTATAVAVMTGRNSEFGKISDSLARKAPETDFEHGVRQFGYFLSEVTLLLLIALFACNVFLGRPVVESMLFALALSVGLTPQLLPAIISVNLAHGANIMAKKHVIVKRLASIENFGSMNILCADKTGTLTTNEIHLESALNYKGDKSDKVMLFATLNAVNQSGYNNSIDAAIVKVGHQESNKWQKVDEIPYDFIRKRLSVVVKDETHSWMITKGAFQQVLDCCSFAETENATSVPIATVTDQLQNLFTQYCNKGFRVLAVASLDAAHIAELHPEDEKNMTFLGFLLFWNPPKADIARTLNNLAKLEIELKIITGDTTLVAQHLASLIGMPTDKTLTGSQIQRMSDQALIHHARHCTLFTEVEPNQKERIILALRHSGNAVGFIGDGINDVTALHAADVSISVESATDAAKEVADIVLLHKDLSVLQDGVRAGRVTFANTLKYIFMSTSANFGNMFSMAGASLFLSFLPLLPKQVLLTNLLTDMPEMAIATDSVDQEMIEKPLSWNVQFIRRFMLIFGLISSAFDFATFGVLLWLNASVDEFRTGWFVESVVSATLIVLVVRTFRPFLTSSPSPYLLTSVIVIIAATIGLAFTPLAPYLGFTSLPISFYGFLALIVVLYVSAVEIAKKIFLRNGKRTNIHAKMRRPARSRPLFHF